MRTVRQAATAVEKMNKEIPIANRFSTCTSAIVTRISVASTMITIHWSGPMSA